MNTKLRKLEEVVSETIGILCKKCENNTQLLLASVVNSIKHFYR